jgi:hypothetical protein
MSDLSQSKEARLCDLFSRWEEKWRNERPGEKFFKDGIATEAVFESQRPRIAFVLKEPNDNFELRHYVYDPTADRGSSPNFWPNLSMWSYAVQEVYGGRPAKEVTFEAAEEWSKKTKLDYVSYINLKKSCENRPVSDLADIKDYVDTDWDFIREEIAIIAPDVLVFCGGKVFDKAVRPHLEKMRLQPAGSDIYGNGTIWLWTLPGRIVVRFHHPSQRRDTRRANFNELLHVLADLCQSKVQADLR